MARSLELLWLKLYMAPTSSCWFASCKSAATSLGLTVTHTEKYSGNHDLLALFGYGADEHALAWREHASKGRLAFCWDVGYLGKVPYKERTMVRVSINSEHPTFEDLQRTTPDPSRWRELGLRLRNDYDPNGHVVVIGMGPKSRSYLRTGPVWEMKALEDAAKRFPDRRIVYRPKPRKFPWDTVPWEDQMEKQSIDEVLRGASLVICRHSNVAIDACLAGIPVECESGAAHWLYSRGSNPCHADRLDFLHRLCWWQWRVNDMENAWRFLLNFKGLRQVNSD